MDTIQIIIPADTMFLVSIFQRLQSATLLIAGLEEDGGGGRVHTSSGREELLDGRASAVAHGGRRTKAGRGRGRSPPSHASRFRSGVGRMRPPPPPLPTSRTRTYDSGLGRAGLRLSRLGARGRLGGRGGGEREGSERARSRSLAPVTFLCFRKCRTLQ